MSKVTFIGGGNMGFALVAGVATSELSHELVVAEPDAIQRERFNPIGVATHPNNLDAVEGAEVVVLAVKPQIIRSVAEEISGHITDKLVISIAAGTPLSSLSTWLGKKTAIVRCMPNTPALVGEGITGMYCSEQVTSEQRQVAQSLMSVCGPVVWLDSDDELDMVTALSGSGPAYFFSVIESLIKAGQSLGLSQEVAKQLVIQTAVGSSRMVSQKGADPSELREGVTSPGGTTAAGLEELGRRSVDQALISAVQKAYDRAKELAKDS